jgi:PAS domain-containing protein
MALDAALGAGLLVVAVVALGVALFEVRRRRADHGFHAGMLDALDEWVCRFRLDDQVVTYCNAAWAASVGTSPRAAVGRNLAAFITPAAMTALHALIA